MAIQPSFRHQISDHSQRRQRLQGPPSTSLALDSESGAPAAPAAPRGGAVKRHLEGHEWRSWWWNGHGYVVIHRD